MSDYSPRRARDEDENESFFCRFTFGQFFAILLLEVFTLFFVFYLGARYGREFLGLEKVRIAGASIGETVKVTTTDDPEASKMAREIIATAKTPELKERIAKMLGTDASGKADLRKQPDALVQRKLESPEQGNLEHGGGVASLPPGEPLEQEALQPHPETTVEKPSPLIGKNDPKAATPTPSGVVRVKSAENNKYSIQVGSYPELADANTSVERWKGKGYPAYMMIADIPDRGRWYRVRIGGFGSRNDAEDYMRQLAAQEGVEALVVLNEQ